MFFIVCLFGLAPEKMRTSKTERKKESGEKGNREENEKIRETFGYRELKKK